MSSNEHMAQESIICPFCKTDFLNPLYELEDSEREEIVKKLEAGQMIQNAAPQLSSTQREMLISGICKECQKSIFGA